MKNLFNSLHLNNRFFYGLTFVALCFLIGFFIPVISIISKSLLLLLVLLTLVDVLVLFFQKEGVTLERILPEKLSNGDKNNVRITVTNHYKFPLHVSLLEELPFQFQKRIFDFNYQIASKATKVVDYELTPYKRGVYHFGHVNTFISSPLQLATRKYVLANKKELKCYPSFLKLKDFGIKAFTDQSSIHGNKKVRRIGHSLEFEQIKEYVSGDDIRTINWKATAKRNQLMINQYVEEKSQPIYSVIDKGRLMEMHFDSLSLLDYAVNATLSLSYAALRKQDRAGMLTFTGKVEDFINAEQRNSQMNLISEALYNVKTEFTESDFGALYSTIKKRIPNRSLLILYTNFEAMDSLYRQLPYLRGIAKSHLLLVVFFENTELSSFLKKEPQHIQEVYDTIIAEKFVYEKQKIVKELKKYGIHSLLTKPKNLTDNTINKYLELKSRGMI